MIASTPPNSSRDSEWERKTLRELLMAAVDEQRRTRRWGNLFRLLIVVYLFAVLMLANFKLPNWMKGESGKHTALVEVAGVIADDMEANADSVVSALQDAFEDPDTAGIILRINSPGGSPVQSGYINDEIVRLREMYPETRLYAVISDVCASGGYYIAAAADEIYADKASIVGSIGVRMDSFGFVSALERLGIERRLHTAGENKGFLDPFLPEQPGQIAHLNELLGEIHQQFINTVKRGRGDRLKDDPRLYTGLFWTGEQGLALGLVDGLGSAGYVAREIIGAEDIVDFSTQKSLLEEIGEGLGETAAQLALPNFRLY